MISLGQLVRRISTLEKKNKSLSKRLSKFQEVVLQMTYYNKRKKLFKSNIFNIGELRRVKKILNSIPKHSLAIHCRYVKGKRHFMLNSYQIRKLHEILRDPIPERKG